MKNSCRSSVLKTIIVIGTIKINSVEVHDFFQIVYQFFHFGMPPFLICEFIITDGRKIYVPNQKEM